MSDNITDPILRMQEQARLKAEQGDYGTVRRCPDSQGFAHAIRLDQNLGSSPEWKVIDLYGPIDLCTFEEVKDWPVVYTPVPDEEWAQVHP